MKILSIFKNFLFFAFSTHEKEEIKKIYQYLEYQGVDISSCIEVGKIPIINLQLGKFESMLEALYSIHPDIRISGDTLFRNNRLVNQLFYAHKYEEIVVHNQNCLVNESIIFRKRWLKLYMV